MIYKYSSWVVESLWRWDIVVCLRLLLMDLNPDSNTCVLKFGANHNLSVH